MRKRSKSVAVARKELEIVDTSSSSESDCSDEQENPAFTNNEGTAEWPAEDELLLIKNVKAQIINDNTRPYDVTLQNIDWNEVSFREYSTRAVESHFQKMLNGIRKFRCLTELIHDAEKNIYAKVPKPKRPRNAFIHFMEAEKNTINEHKEDKFFTQKASEMFKGLSDIEKQKYFDKAKEEKKDYEKVVKNVMEKLSLESPTKLNKDKPKQKLDTPYHLFYKNKVMTEKDVKKSAARTEYRNLDNPTKLTWILRWLGVKKGNKLNAIEYQKSKQALSSLELAIVDEYERRPKRLNVYNIFVKDMSAKYPNVPMSKLMKICSEKWRNLSMEEKRHYAGIKKNLKLEYAESHKTFLNSLPPDRQSFESGKTNKSKTQSNDKRSVTEDSPKKVQGENHTLRTSDEVNSKSKTQTKKDRKVSSSSNSSEEPPKSILKPSEGKKKKPIKRKSIDDLDAKTDKKKQEKQSAETKGKKRKVQNSDSAKRQAALLREIPKKPPSTLYKYYVLCILNGNRTNAKHKFKSMPATEKKALNIKYCRITEEYITDIRTFLKKLSPEELALCEPVIRKRDDDDISDITSSESSSASSDSSDSD